METLGIKIDLASDIQIMKVDFKLIPQKDQVIYMQDQVI